MIYYNSLRGIENKNRIKQLSKEWSEGPILRIKTLKADPVDIKDDAKLKEKYSYICKNILGKSTYIEEFDHDSKPKRQTNLNTVNINVIGENESIKRTSKIGEKYMEHPSFKSINTRKTLSSQNSEIYYSNKLLLPLDQFQGTYEGCMCNDKIYTISCSELKDSNRIKNSHSGSSSSFADILIALFNVFSDVVHELTCKNIPPLTEKNIYIWKNTLFCVERINKNYLDFKISSSSSKCSMNYKNCGIIDNYKNYLCIPYKYECPINHISITKEKNDVNINMEKIFNNKNDDEAMIIDSENSKKINKLSINRKSIPKEKKERINQSYLDDSQNIKMIISKFAIMDYISCNKNDEKIHSNNDYILQYDKNKNKIMDVEKSNIIDYMKNNLLDEFKLLKNNTLNKTEKNPLLIEHDYKNYNLFKKDSTKICLPNNPDQADSNKNYVNITYNDFNHIDEITYKDLFYQNGLIEKIIDLPKFPKDYILFNTSLYYASYTGMEVSCRDLLLEMINFDTNAILSYAKNVDDYYPSSNLLSISFILIFIGLIAEFFWLKNEYEFDNSFPGEKILKFRESNFKRYLYFKIPLIIIMIILMIHLKFYPSIVEFRNINDKVENKAKEDINLDNTYSKCQNNINFKILIDSYLRYNSINSYFNLFYIISFILVIYPIVRISYENKDYTEENIERQNIIANEVSY